MPSSPCVKEFGIARAEAMAYRDARGAAIADADWAEIEAQLRQAYLSLKASLRD